MNLMPIRNELALSLPVFPARLALVARRLARPCSAPTTGPNGAARDRDGTSRRPTCRRAGRPAGENVAWSLPFGGRSTPVIFGNRLYLQTITTGAHRHDAGAPGRGGCRQRQGVWERRVSVYHQRRAAATAPAGRRRPSIRRPATSICSRSAPSCWLSRPTASCSGIARCPRNTARSPRTAAAPRRRSSRATRSSSTR